MVIYFFISVSELRLSLHEQRLGGTHLKRARLLFYLIRYFRNVELSLCAFPSLVIFNLLAD